MMKIIQMMEKKRLTMEKNRRTVDKKETGRGERSRSRRMDQMPRNSFVVATTSTKNKICFRTIALIIISDNAGPEGLMNLFVSFDNDH